MIKLLTFFLFIYSSITLNSSAYFYFNKYSSLCVYVLLYIIARVQGKLFKQFAPSAPESKYLSHNLSDFDLLSACLFLCPRFI